MTVVYFPPPHLPPPPPEPPPHLPLPPPPELHWVWQLTPLLVFAVVVILKVNFFGFIFLSYIMVQLKALRFQQIVSSICDHNDSIKEFLNFQLRMDMLEAT